MIKGEGLVGPLPFFISVDVAPAFGRSASVAHDSERSTRDRTDRTFFNTDRTFLIGVLILISAPLFLM